MGINLNVKDWITKLLVNALTAKIIDWLNGRKTVIGALSLLLWITIYAVPAFTPEYNFITVYATQVRDILISAGVNLDNSLFNTGVGFTVVGLLDKIRKLIKER